MAKIVTGQRLGPERVRRLPPDVSRDIGTKLTAAAEFSARYSIYPMSVSLRELTTAQALVLALFHTLLHKDKGVTMALLEAVQRVPQVWSSFIEVWLRDDYRFRRQDVAGMLAALSSLMLVDGVSVPVSIVAAMTGLEEKYQVLDFFKQSKDFTSQYLLVCLCHLVKRATGKSADVKDCAVQAKVVTREAWTQATEQKLTVIIATDSVKPKRSAEKAQMGKKKKYGSSPKKRRKIKNKSAAHENDTIKNAVADLCIPSLHQEHRIIIEKVKDYPPTIRIPEIGPPASTSVIERSRSLTKKRAERALISAAVTGDPAVAEQALVAGANPNCSDQWGRTPLHLASRHGHSTLVGTLLIAGAAINQRDKEGWTPLHRASYHGYTACIKLLLDCGADRCLPVNGSTPLELAQMQGHDEVVELIRYRPGLFY